MYYFTLVLLSFSLPFEINVVIGLWIVKMPYRCANTLVAFAIDISSVIHVFSINQQSVRPCSWLRGGKLIWIVVSLFQQGETQLYRVSQKK